MASRDIHDYSGEKRPSGPAGGGQVGADSKTITVSRTGVAGVLKWLSGSPSPVKASYAAGESVSVDCGMHNDGDVAVAPTITITDADTGASLFNYTFATKCSGKADLWIYGVVVGKMPDKATWRLKCDLSP